MIHSLKIFVFLVFAALSSHVYASYAFQYTGTVRSVGGTVTDGTLLPFNASEAVSGGFIFDPISINQSNEANAEFFQNSIHQIYFGDFSDSNPENSYSYFLSNANTGVGTGSIYDNFEFLISAGSGVSPFFSTPLDFGYLSLLNFKGELQFLIQRVDISSSGPLRFTQVIASIDFLEVQEVPEPETFDLILASLGAMVALRRNSFERKNKQIA